MNIQMIRDNGWIEYECIVGSRAYGTDTPKSDEDRAGIFITPNDLYLVLEDPIERVGDDKSDLVFYSLKRYIGLLETANPNLIEMLWMPECCIKVCSSRMRLLIENRDLFITRKAYHSHTGYGFAQIKKAKGTNKWINNPKPKEPPQRYQFCWVIPAAELNGADQEDGRFPCRPLPYLEQSAIVLESCHVAALEHVKDTYRLYKYGETAKGVFRNGNLVCESILKEDERSKFVGLLVYNDNEYQKEFLDWKNYWTWVKERNPERWELQEQGAIGYDQKNMMHCVRLMMSGERILREGKPIVRFEGEQLKYLRDIRAGLFSYEALMEDVEARMKTLEELEKTSSLPWGVDHSKVQKLYKNMTQGLRWRFNAKVRKLYRNITQRKELECKTKI